MTKDEAIKFFGSPSKLAKACDVSRQAVNRWEEIPLTRQFQIQVITEGKLVADTKRAAA